MNNSIISKLKQIADDPYYVSASGNIEIHEVIQELAKRDKIKLEPALRFNPFPDDFGEQGDKILQDKIVKSRKAHDCHHCKGGILKGDLVRSRTDVFDGEIATYRWCNTCTSLMARLDDEEAEQELEERIPYKPTPTSKQP